MNASEDEADAQSVEPTMTPVSLLRHGRRAYLTFEYCDGNEVHKLRVDDFVQLPTCWLQGCKRKKICTSIPREMVNSMELSDDGGEGSAYDRGVESDKESA
jgi:hypothetical protein